MALTRALFWLLSVGGLAAIHQPYDDSMLTLTSIGTPDPFVRSFSGQYYLTFTAGDRIEIWTSNSLVDIEATAIKHQIWKPPQGTDHSADIWAPELHALRGRWYIYYTAANPKKGNKSHRLYVLGGPPATDDPVLGQWEFLGRIYDMPDQWAIDGTVFELKGQLYLAYSGWPLESPSPKNGSCATQNGGNNTIGAHTNTTTPTTTTTTAPAAATAAPGMVQHLFLMRLDHPSTAGSRPVAIGVPQQAWETTHDAAGAHAINEGPQWLAAPDGRWRGLVYSCAGSWTPEYKMATLRYRGGEPLDPASWEKGHAPLLQTVKPPPLPQPQQQQQQQQQHRLGGGRGRGGLFGPGHGSFLDVGGGHVVAVYHATDGPDDGWDHRRARVQRVAFTERGPYMGKSFGVEGPFKGDGLVARIRARIARSRKSGVAETEDLRTFLEARRLENEARVDEM
ncbi:glycoside hydrolase family 43 protein [Nemania diffusa]|nr:glycoside hydrolase family 43 protein [Nemania diffusa]